MLALLTILTGFVYPAVTTAIALIAFPHQAHGSLLPDNRGSELIGQWTAAAPGAAFNEDPKYFWPRLSATSPAPYNSGNSTGSNFGPLSADLKKEMDGRRDALRKADPGNTAEPPADLLTSSGSGLDPHISPEAAAYQAGRVARLRQLDLGKVQAQIDLATEGRQFGILGEPRVNVVKLNRLLEQIH